MSFCRETVVNEEIFPELWSAIFDQNRLDRFPGEPVPADEPSWVQLPLPLTHVRSGPGQEHLLLWGGK